MSPPGGFRSGPIGKKNATPDGIQGLDIGTRDRYRTSRLGHNSRNPRAARLLAAELPPEHAGEELYVGETMTLSEMLELFRRFPEPLRRVLLLFLESGPRRLLFFLVLREALVG